MEQGRLSCPSVDALRSGIKYCSTTRSPTGQVFEQVRWPWEDAEWGSQEVSDYNYTFIRMNAGLSPLLCLSYWG